MGQRFKDRPSGPLFWVAVGLATGVAATMLVSPQRQIIRTDARAGTTGEQADSQEITGPVGSASGSPGVVPGLTANGSADGPGGIAGGGGGGLLGRVRGVDANSVTIGVGCNDLTEFRALGQAYNEGDCQKQFEATLNAARREKRVPINGRDLKFVFRKYSLLRTETQRSACVGFIQEDRVFAVLANQYFGTGIPCVGQENKTAVLSSDGPYTDDLVKQSMPYAFTVAPTASRVLRNYPHWLESRGLLTDARIGLYYSTYQGRGAEIEKYFIGELKRMGYGDQIVETVTTTQQLAGPDDSVAVERFHDAQVSLALLIINGYAQTQFMQTADFRGYHFTYADSDFAAETEDAAGATKPDSQYDGTYAYTTLAHGVVGLSDSPQILSCIQNYEQFAGTAPPRRGSVEWQFILRACDLVDLLIVGLQGAGRTLTTPGFIGSLEQVRGRPMRRVPEATFGPQKHSGGDHQRTIRWNAACKCFTSVSKYGPLWVA